MLRKSVTEGNKENFYHSLVMGAVIYLVTSPMTNELLKLAVGIPLGIVIYLLIAWVFRLPELKEAIDIIRRK